MNGCPEFATQDISVFNQAFQLFRIFVSPGSGHSRPGSLKLFPYKEKSYFRAAPASETVELVVDYCNENSILPVYAKVNSLKNEASVKVLVNNSFEKLMPLIANPTILKTKDLESIIRDKDLGMMFVLR